MWEISGLNLSTAVVCLWQYTDGARLWVWHSDMLPGGWNVNTRPKAECDIPTEGQHIWMSHKQSCDICFVVWPTLNIFFCHWRKRESLSSVIYDINAHTSSYRLRLSVRVNWSDTARQMLYTRPAVTWIRVELRTRPNSNPNPYPNPNPNRVLCIVKYWINDKRPAVCIDTLIQQTYLKNRTV